MKKTYLVFRDNPDGTKYLDIATDEEWRGILRENKRIKAEIQLLNDAHDAAADSTKGLAVRISTLEGQLRYFIKDLIVEGCDWDQLLYETSRSEYLVWNREYAHQKDNWKFEKYYGHVYLDAPAFDEDDESCLVGDIIPAPTSAIDQLEDRIYIEELRSALSAWRPWALDMLDAYLDNDKKDCNALLMSKYGISERSVERYKIQFEKFVKNFKKGCRFWADYSPR